MKPVAFIPLIILMAATATAQTGQTPTGERTAGETTASDNDVIAVVLDRKITAKDKDRLTGLIVGALLERFARENGIEPTEEEIDLFVAKTEEMERRHRIEVEKSRRALEADLKDATLSAREREDKETWLRLTEEILKTYREMEARGTGMEAQLRQVTRRVAHRFVMRWKVNRALHARYGGRVIFQQAGVEPLDAYRDFLREQQKAGAFRILDKTYEAPFGRYFTKAAMQVFYGKDDGAKFIETPWWLMGGAAGR